MKKLLTATGTAMLLANMTIAPAFADSLAQQTTPRQQQQVVLPEGEMMSDAELSEVEGEAFPIFWTVLTVGGAGVGGYVGYRNCATTGRKDCWVDAGWGAVGGAGTVLGYRGAMRGGGGFGGGAYGR